MENLNTIQFSLGQTVLVKSDYHGDAPHRMLPGIVVKHEHLDGALYKIDGKYVDNCVQFPTGEIEPYGNWELEHPNGEASEANAQLIAIAPELVETLRDILNGLYALRDHAQNEGLTGSVEQRLIDLGIQTLRKVEGRK